MDRLDNGREYLAAAENGLNMRWPDVHTATTEDYTRATYLAIVDATRALIGIGRILDHLTSTATPDTDSAPAAGLSTRCTATDDGIRRCILTRNHNQDHYLTRTEGRNDQCIEVRADGRRCVLDHEHPFAHVYRTPGATRCLATDGPGHCALDAGHTNNHISYGGWPFPRAIPTIGTYITDGPCPDIPLECLPDGWRNAQHGETRALEAMPDSLRCPYSAYTSTGRTIRCARPHHHDGTPMHAAPGPAAVSGA